jgi:hypothetical protein
VIKIESVNSKWVRKHVTRHDKISPQISIPFNKELKDQFTVRPTQHIFCTSINICMFRLVGYPSAK